MTGIEDGAAAANDNDASADPPKRRRIATLKRADQIPEEAIRWYWKDWLAAGKLHILAGAKGAGKTTIALDMAAAISSGGTWPDGTAAPAGDVVIWTGEDGLADTLNPRLAAAGADMARIHYVDGLEDGGKRVRFDPAKHMDALREAVSELPSVKLVIMDSVVSVVDGDSHKNAETRRGLQPLCDLLSETGAAGIGITHFTKGTAGNDPVERITGSLAFGAVARMVLVAVRPEPDESGAEPPCMLLRAASNITPKRGGFEYRTEEAVTPRGTATSRIRWGQVVLGQARWLLSRVERSAADAGRALSEAEVFLKDTLRSGRLTCKEVERSAKEAGLSMGTVQRAKARLGVRSVRDSKANVWFWELQSERPDTFYPSDEIFADDGNT
jgi:hypothetical protein